MGYYRLPDRGLVSSQNIAVHKRTEHGLPEVGPQSVLAEGDIQCESPFMEIFWLGKINKGLHVITLKPQTSSFPGVVSALQLHFCLF